MTTATRTGVGTIAITDIELCPCNGVTSCDLRIDRARRSWTQTGGATVAPTGARVSRVADWYALPLVLHCFQTIPISETVEPEQDVFTQG